MNKPLTDQQTEFLVAYRTEGRVKPAAARAGCSRELHYNALRTSETYRKAFAMVQGDLVDELEEEMRQRAVYGVKIPKFYRGEVIGYETRYSDTLLMALLEVNDPEKFRRDPGGASGAGPRRRFLCQVGSGEGGPAHVAADDGAYAAGSASASAAAGAFHQ